MGAKRPKDPVIQKIKLKYDIIIAGVSKAFSTF